MTLDDALEFIAISAPEEHGNLADEWQEGFYVEVDVQAESSGPRVGQQSWQTSARGPPSGRQRPQRLAFPCPPR